MSELTHFGVPGMKWGHRKGPQVGDRIKAPDGQMATVVSPPRRLSRKEVRAVNKAGREQWANDKATKIIDAAAKDSLIKVMGQDGYPLVITGKQMMDHLSKNGVFNIDTTDVWANKTESGKFQLAAPTSGYKKIKR